MLISLVFSLWIPWPHVPVAVVVEFVVRRKSDEPSPGGRQGEENLSGSILPHLERSGESQVTEGDQHVTFPSKLEVTGDKRAVSIQMCFLCLKLKQELAGRF